MHTDSPIRVVVADDEPLARARLTDLLAREPGVHVVAECRDGLEAVQAIQRHHPDLVLLDVQMPRLTGLEVIRAVGPDEMPLTVLVTAHGEFALEAFELRALDYLLKPFDEARLRAALARARERLSDGGRRAYEAELRALLQRMAATTERPARFVVRRGQEYLLVRPDEIDWVQSADNYVTLHCGAREYMLRETMTTMEEQLDPARFVRIRASAIVNLDRVTAIRAWSGTEFQFVLADGTTLLSSRRFRDRLRSVIP
jgi:two-component system, LytTR family, response regulator